MVVGTTLSGQSGSEAKSSENDTPTESTPVLSPVPLPIEGTSVAPLLDTPPPPPSGFNPDPELSAESIFHTIAAIASPPSSHDVSPAPGLLTAQLDLGGDGGEMSPPSRGTASGGGSIPHVESFSALRPALLALQRVSHDSNHSVNSEHSLSSTSVQSDASGNSDSTHLADMRDRLIESQVAAAEARSAGPSRGNSVDQIEWKVTEATPPIEPVTGKLETEGEAEHAWDSVWPTAQTVQRAADTSLERHKENTRFPITAPISPFITPTFSPALVGRASPAPPPRQSASPTSGSSSSIPLLHTRSSPRPVEVDYAIGASANRRRSVSYDQPLLHSPTLAAQPVSIAKHQRSFSSSSATPHAGNSGSLNGRSINQSPLAGTGSAGHVKKTPPASPTTFRPSSPAMRGPQRRSLGSATGSSSSTPTTARARGLSVTSGSAEAGKGAGGDKTLLSVDEYRDPGPSVQRRPSPTPLAAPPVERVPSNDDVPALGSRLPPAVTAPDFTNRSSEPLQTRDDANLAPPLYAPLARPANLRRALSDFDPKPRPAPSLIRSQSLESELEKSPKRTPAHAEFTSPPPDAVQRGETDYRPKKSPRRSPADLPSGFVPNITPLIPPIPPHVSDKLPPPEESTVALVDEGDVLPSDADLYMDVTFEDEGLSTLERIFLLSKSEFPFHRNYIARVIGDLLYDVDPCESVEYILPLISSFPLDEDEGVRESFAQELHRILWYFYATCRMTPPDVDNGEAVQEDLTLEEGDGEGQEPLLDRPPLSVDFFTPLLGSLLLNSNNVVSEAARTSVVLIIARLLGKAELKVERWGVAHEEQKEDPASVDAEASRKTYIAQTGAHAHRTAAMLKEEKDMIELELLSGIVIGMGSLSTEMPEDMYEGEIQFEEDIRAFQAQLVAEATAGRATSMNLIGALCEHYTGDEAVQWGFVDEVLRCADGDAAVRAEGAMALAALAKIAPIEHIHRLMPLFQQLATDDVLQVRQSVCIALPALCRRIENHADRRQFAVDSMELLGGQAMPHELQHSLLDVAGELIYAFHDVPEGPPETLMAFYGSEELAMYGLNHTYWTVTAFNFPAVCLTLGASRWSELRQTYHSFFEDDFSPPEARRSVAASLHEIAKILEPEQCEEDLMPMYRRCMEHSDEYRELVYEHLDVFFSRLPQNVAWEAYLELAQKWKDNKLGGWRAREQLALHIPQFFRIFHDVMRCEVLYMMKDALLDPFAAVRDAATKGIPTSYEVLGDQSDIAQSFRETLLDLGRSPKYRQRLTFVRCLREFVKPPPNKQAFEDFFLPFLGSLSDDVVDVRLGLAQSVADLFVVGAYYAEKVHAPRAMYGLARKLAGDESVDVRDTVRNVDLDHLDKYDTVPHEIKSTEVPKRALTPGDIVPEQAPEQVGMGSRSPLSRKQDVNGDSAADEVDHGRKDIDAMIPESMKQANTDERPSSEAAEPPRKSCGSSDGPARSSSSSTAASPVSSQRSTTNTRPGRLDRTASSDMMSHLNRMVLRTPTSDFPSTLSPFFGTGLGVTGAPLPLGSPRPGPRTPGGSMVLGIPRTPGSYLSSPSPNEPAGGKDPFARAFATVTPDKTPEMVPVSPGGSVSSLDGN